VADERLHGVVEHLLDALELPQAQRAGLGRVVAVRLLAVDAGQAPGDGVRREPPREQGGEVAAAQHRRVADVPPLGAGGLVGQDVAARHVVDVDVPHPPVRRELPRLSCDMVFLTGIHQKLEHVCAGCASSRSRKAAHGFMATLMMDQQLRLTEPDEQCDEI
jgi:hypothetical protein